MNEPNITLCRLNEFAEVSGLFPGKKPCTRTINRWKKRGIVKVDPVTGLVDIEETKRRFIARRNGVHKK